MNTVFMLAARQRCEDIMNARYRSFVLHTLMGALLLMSGCATVSKVAAKPGDTAAPPGVRPLVFVTVRLESNVRGWLDAIERKKYCVLVESMILEDVATKKWYMFTAKSSLWSRFVSVPFGVEPERSASYIPFVITLKPGSYRVARVCISTREGQSVGMWDPKADEAVQLVVPDRDFVSWGTLKVTLDDKGTTVGDFLAFLELNTCRKEMSVEPMSSAERAFATKTYPFLEGLLTD